MKVAANLTFMFQECGYLLQRYEAAASAGFKYVECANPYEANLDDLVKKKEDLGLQQVLINVPMGRKEHGTGFGFACIPEKKAEFRESINIAINYAKALKCPRIHVMSGKAPAETLRIQAEETYIENVKFAAEKMAEVGITCLIEPINQYSVPGYFLHSYDQALNYIEPSKCPNLKLQLDIFHLQQICGQLTPTIQRLLPYTGHIQIAQVPHRHEPDSAGEIDYGYIFDLLKREGYGDFIGCEYVPAAKTVDGLRWIEKFGLQFS